MAVQSKTTVKSYFETGDTPTQAQFVDLIDSYQDFSQPLTDLAAVIATANTSGRFLVSDGNGSASFVPASQLQILNGVLLVNDLRVSGAANFRNVDTSGKVTTSALNTKVIEASGTASFNSNTDIGGRLTAGEIKDWDLLFIETVSAAKNYDYVRSAPYAYIIRGVRYGTKGGATSLSLEKNGVPFLTIADASAGSFVSAAVCAAFAVGDSYTVSAIAVSGATSLSLYTQKTRGL